MTKSLKSSRKYLSLAGKKTRKPPDLTGGSESEAAPNAADFARAAEEIGAAIRALHALGGIEDVFRRLPGEAER